MAGIPPLQTISQQHTNVYENYYRQVNPGGLGSIGAVEAAKFLKKSNLPEGTLHKIWELSDQGSKGYLDKQGFYIALKLISLAQNGMDCSMKSLGVPTSPPNMGDSPVGMTLAFSSSAISDTTSWGINAKSKQQYDGIFDSLKPMNGLLSGDKVKPVLLNSKLPVDKLGMIWELSDIDLDGSLDRDEFAVAMHLVYRALDGDAVPLTLPANLIPPSKRKAIKTAVTSSLPTTILPPPSSNLDAFSSSLSTGEPAVAKSGQWIVQPADKLKYDQMFANADSDKDGLVSGAEIKDILIASGLAQNYLAHIWNLCDTNNTGRLNSDQFALAMYLIKLKRSGKELPQALTPEMMPPSASNDLASITIASTSNDFSAIKELDVITTNIESLGREKVKLQQEITETEEAIRNRRKEIEKLKNELEKANKGLEVLKQQKQESQTNLESLDIEHDRSLTLLKEVQTKSEDEKQHLHQLRTKLSSQESQNKEEEQEMAKCRKELDDLKKEESDIESQIKKNKAHLESMKYKCATTKSEVTQAQGRIDKLNDENNSLKEEINRYASNSALSSLNDTFDARFKDVDQISARATAGSSPVSSISGFSIGSSGKVDDDDFKDNDPFKSKIDLFSNESEVADPFNSDDPFKSDPFKSVSFADDPFTGDPFASSETSDPFKADPFKASTNSLTDSEKQHPIASGPDPFGTLDPFGSGAFVGGSSTDISFQTQTSKTSTADPFANTDMFSSQSTVSVGKGDEVTTNTSPLTKSGDPFSNDPFGSNDPFATATVTTSSDPFAASADDPFASSSGSTADPFKSNSGTSEDLFAASATKSNGPFASSNDPFSNNSKDDPFASSTNTTASTDPFSTSSAKSDGDANWFAFSDGKSGNTKNETSEKVDSQLEWVKRESERAEKDRQRRMKELADKEEMDIALALKQSVESSSEA